MLPQNYYDFVVAQTLNMVNHLPGKMCKYDVELLNWFVWIKDCNDLKGVFSTKNNILAYKRTWNILSQAKEIEYNLKVICKKSWI